MAKNNNSQGTNWTKITNFCAFWSVFIAGLMFTVNGILKLVGASVNFGIINTLATIFLVLSLVIPGWRYSKKMPMWARVVFWVFAVLLIAFSAVSFNF